MQELGISMGSQRSKGLAEVPMNEIDLVVSFDQAHKLCANLPGLARIEDWTVPNSRAKRGASKPNLSAIREDRDEIDKRVFALFLDHWCNS
jgi:protein-tyrosine-phosphatase